MVRPALDLLREWELSIEECDKLRAENGRLRSVLSRIARQGPHYGVDNHPWQHWARIAELALSEEEP